MKCPSCGEELEPGTDFCPACDQPLCPKCGAAVSEDDLTCPACGHEFTSTCPRCEAEVEAEDTVCPNCSLKFYKETEEPVVLGNCYRIKREIRAGWDSRVYLAEDTRHGRLVAVKVLYPQPSEDMAYVQRFTREAKLGAALHHPNIVQVHDFGCQDDVYYMVMEYIEGRNLKEIIRERGPLLYREALEIAAQVAEALRYIDQFSIVHRDIKPQHLMIAADGTVIVLDFGLARVGALPSLTRSAIVGTPHYFSPEQAMGEGVDVRSDIYSLGVVMYEMLTNSLPFDAATPLSMIIQHITGDPPTAPLDEAGVPAAVKNLVLKALEKRPEDRFQSPKELLGAIETILRDNEVCS